MIKNILYILVYLIFYTTDYCVSQVTIEIFYGFDQTKHKELYQATIIGDDNMYSIEIDIPRALCSSNSPLI